VLLGAIALVVTLVSCRDFPFDSEREGYGFNGDWETGDFSQWDQVNYIEDFEPRRIAIVDEPVRQGSRAARFEVRPGDKTTAGNEYSESATGERAEVARHFDGQEGEGDEYFYSFSMFLPEDWVQEQDGWRIPLQFHSVDEQLNGRSPVPPLAFNFLPREGRPNGEDEGGFFVLLHGGDLTDTESAENNSAEILPLPIATGVWHDFIFQVRWDPEDGAVRVWHRADSDDEDDFELRAELEDVPTLLYVTEPERSVSEVFMRQGLYRADNEEGQTNVLYLDATRRGESFDAMTEVFGSDR
jgi:hypothetical protein